MSAPLTRGRVRKTEGRAVKIATWNINGVVKRLPLLLRWLDEARPDVVALQETKATEADFPTAALADAGYHSTTVGERPWNGVALLSRIEPVTVRRALPGDPSDRHARYLEAAIDGVLYACLYAPNGNPQPGPKFDHKLAWLDRFAVHSAGLYETGLPIALIGDFNVVPTDADIYSTRSYGDNALLQPSTRSRYAALVDQGWCDAIRTLHPTRPMFTFWDYMRNRWPRDAGLRIDHLLLSPPLAKRLVGGDVDRHVRGWTGASDHAPVWVECGVLKATRRR